MDAKNIDYTKLYNIARDILDYYKEQLKNQKIDASGTLSKTADFDWDFNGSTATLYFILESYWRFVEEGRQPTRGEYGAWTTKYRDIQEWIRNKVSRGYFVPKNGQTIPTTDRDIRRVSGAIVYKITKHGFYDYNQNGKHILQSVLDQAEANGLIDQMVDYLAKVYEQDIDIQVQKLW